MEIDTVNPHIIHIFEDGVRSTPNYPLFVQVPRIDYSGPVGGLLKQFSDKNIHGEPIGAGELSSFDPTPTHVSATNQLRLNILTEAIPLDKYGAVLWIASLNKEGSVTVNFWPKPPGGFESFEQNVEAFKKTRPTK